MKFINDTILVGFSSSSNGDSPCLIIGRKDPGKEMTVINAFEGKEAIDLYKKLITPKLKEKPNEENH